MSERIWIEMCLIGMVCLLIGFVFGALIENENHLFAPKEISMTKRVIAISSQWDDCWLSIGEDDNALYWKCHRFASRIGKWICKTEKEAKKK